MGAETLSGRQRTRNGSAVVRDAPAAAHSAVPSSMTLCQAFSVLMTGDIS